MIELEIGNSISKFTGLTIAQHKELKALLSYELPSRPGNRPKLASLFERKGSFPTGLLSKVLLHMSWNEKYNEHVTDTRKVPNQVTFPTFKMLHDPYPEQIEAVRSCVAHQRGIVSAVTGFGKSIMITMLVQALKVPTLIVVPNLELKRQLSETFLKAFGPTSLIRVENVDALDPDKPLKGIDCVIIDEFQHAAAKTYRALNKKAWNDVYYRFGFTGTPFRNRDEEQILLESILSQVIYKVSYSLAVKKGYIAPVEAFYVEVPTTPELKGMKGWASVYKYLIVNNSARNAIISNIMYGFIKTKSPAICLVKEIAHGKQLEQDYIPFIKGENDNNREILQKFNEGKFNVILGTYGVLGEGVDSKRCEFVIVAGLGKSRPAFMQQIGRALRISPGKTVGTIILIKDNSHKYLKDHFDTQVKILEEEYGIKPLKLEI